MLVNEATDIEDLSPSNRANYEERLYAVRYRFWKRSVGGFMREVFFACKESKKWPALKCGLIADRPPQHRILGLECIENAAKGDAAVQVKLDVTANFRQRAQMRWKNNANHCSVCTSTERTAGRSRTMGAHVSPASADAYT